MFSFVLRRLLPEVIVNYAQFPLRELAANLAVNPGSQSGSRQVRACLQQVCSKFANFGFANKFAARCFNLDMLRLKQRAASANLLADFFVLQVRFVQWKLETNSIANGLFADITFLLLIWFLRTFQWFLQRVSIVCYAQRCISYSKIVCPSVRLSVCLSHAGTVSKRLQLRSRGVHCSTVAPWL